MNRNILATLVVLALMSPNAFAKKPTKTNSDPTTNSSTTSDTSMNKSDSQQMDAIQVLLKDHDYIRQTIGKLNKNLDSNVAESRSIFKGLKDYVVKHETMEQKIWYPALEEKNKDLKDIIANLKKDEDDAGKVIKEIDKTKDDSEWVSKVKKFTTNVDNHAKDEENNLFPKVKQTVDQSTLDNLGEKLKKYQSKNNMKN